MSRDKAAITILIAIIAILGAMNFHQFISAKNIDNEYTQRIIDMEGKYTQQITEMESLIKEMNITSKYYQTEVESLRTKVSELEQDLAVKQAEVQQLESEIDKLEQKIDTEQAEIDALEAALVDGQTKILEMIGEIRDLKNTIETLEEKIQALEVVDLKVDLYCEYYPKFWPWNTDTHLVQGILINFGVNDATDVILTLTWIKEDTVIFESTLDVGKILGRSYVLVEVNFYFNGEEDLFLYSVSYN